MIKKYAEIIVQRNTELSVKYNSNKNVSKLLAGIVCRRKKIYQ